MVDVHTLSELRGRRGRGPGRGRGAARGRTSASAGAAAGTRGKGRGRGRSRGSGSAGPFSGAGNSLKDAAQVSGYPAKPSCMLHIFGADMSLFAGLTSPVRSACTCR